ncbi:MAG: DUF4340 domain-containing protein [Candidatus Cloacimonetes bacterium]|jgi:hypothetical protein|nr:DUF4340 domain-containing protein [Candidatus Cloacimonadota bacterium]MCB5287364.1 DUF4340 domain-containing protein [Candidatus Cloacimonadota bacterium]MCK9184333.1 DUF4340 domain-containing protein [Candidatus Cloacimonadota bacterium]MCK9583814.1 DUF4340 domain-containing protein [Candidatus Cloacimonadota bacterium]MDY0229686.1 DUF4340 domain-containing protein [Candidatus Cloacimonadaceae bacterium]
MKRTRLILIILLAVLLLAYIVLRIVKPPESSKAIFRLNLEKLQKIEIFNAEKAVELILDEGIWKVKGDLLWKADSLKIQQFFENVLTAEYPTTAMSEAEGAIERYQLQDEEALHIRVSDKSKKVHVLFSNLGNAWDYFRYDGDTKVYQVKNKVVQAFQPELINWRSPIIIHYWEEDLKQIKVQHEKNTYTLAREGLEWTFHDARNDFKVEHDNYSLGKIISILQNFRSYIFVSGEDEQYRKAFENPMCTLWITDVKGEVRKLDFAEFDAHRYQLRIDDDMSVLYQVEFNTVFRFIRNAEIFKRRGGA